jgi:hypothetical protein
MTSTPEFYRSVLEGAGLDAESLTFVVVAGATREQVAATLGLQLERPVAPWTSDGVDFTDYALGEVPGGVVAIELSGYGDPSLDELRTLSASGAAAVARSNIQAHCRFGFARSGDVVFDDDEFVFIDDPGRVPADLQDLFRLAWTDPDADEDEDTEGSWLEVAMAMVERATGIACTADDLRRARDSGWFVTRSLRYPG